MKINRQRIVVALTKQETLYPLEFFVPETPVSQQASAVSKQRWKTTVRNAARLRVRETDELGWLDDRLLALTIYYFPVAEMKGDIDNIVKPIMDALNTVAYRDDNLVERVVVQKFEPEIGWEFAKPSEQLSKALDAAAFGDPVVYVRVDDDLSWRKN